MKVLNVFKDEVFPYSYIDHDRLVVRAIIVNDKNEIYLIKVQRDDLFGNATYLETPGGGVNKGEDLLIALKREIVEECGLNVDVISEIGIIEDDYNIIHRHNITHYYLCKIVSKCETHREEYESIWFKSLDFYNLDKVISICENPDSDIAKIVYKRELVIYKKVKEMINK